MKIPTLFSTAVIAASLTATALAQTPTPDIARQVLTRRWQELKMPDATERNVLFIDVRATGTGSFEVTALLRDYIPGMGLNNYYGKTCVAQINHWLYKVWSDGSAWRVDGRMTPDLASQKCTLNPSPGVSSIPLSALQGTPAPGGVVAAAPAPAVSGGGVPQGEYRCWSNGQARMLLNFTLGAGGQYTGSDGRSGTLSLDPSTQRISFRGGLLDGAMPPGFSAIYHAPQGRPTVSFRGTGNAEAAFCQKQ